MKKYCPQCGQRYDNAQQRFCLRDGALLSLPDSYRLVGSTLDDKYKIDALVGIGGFGAVYSAHHLGLDRQVAFKILQPNVALQAPEAVTLFESEAKTAARLLHENIVTIHDAGRTLDNISYIAMEWLEGLALDEELAARGRLSFERTAEILRQVASALAFAHFNRTVHRDLKLSNVMLVRRPGGSEQVKVVDFGIAKVLSSAVASTISRSIGTPAYASPEQWKHGAQIIPFTAKVQRNAFELPRANVLLNRRGPNPPVSKTGAPAPKAKDIRSNSRDGRLRRNFFILAGLMALGIAGLAVGVTAHFKQQAVRARADQQQQAQMKEMQNQKEGRIASLREKIAEISKRIQELNSDEKKRALSESLDKLSQRLDDIGKISLEQQQEFNQACDEIVKDLSRIEEDVNNTQGLFPSPEINREPIKV